MNSEQVLLLLSATAIAFLHTLAGPDHYLPFVALSKARGWSLRLTVFWTVLCGVGHVGSSVLLALLGAALHWSLPELQWLQGLRGGLAGWGLLLFGTGYAIWGFVTLRSERQHKHFDQDEKGGLYVYEHRHGSAAQPQKRYAVTPWVLFVIFLLGPCEPMIPLLFLPAAKASWAIMSLLVAVYTLVTLCTMLAMVLAGYFGVGILTTKKLEQYMHPLGGAAIMVCGLGMVLLSW
jgi:hypothetical protein